MRSGSVVVRASSATVVAVLAGMSAVGAQAPSPSTGSGLDATLAAVELMNRVPVGIRETCRPTDPFIDGMDIAIECSVDDGLVFYSRFVDRATVDAAYGSLRDSSGTGPDAGDGCAAGASESVFGNEDGTGGGRLLCHFTNGAYIAVWTPADEPILAGILLDSDTGFEALAATWEGARLSSGSGEPVGSSAPVGSRSPVGSAAPIASSAPVASASTAPADATEGEVMLQWASSASASSEYGSDAWGAIQATGEPDTPEYGDFATAWAPAGGDVGPQWLEVGYDVPVRPTEVVIWESSGAGFVTLVEALDEATGEWVTLWEGTDGSPDFLVGFSPPLQMTAVVTDTLRITIDTTDPEWDEVDAVGLFGIPVEP
jgi:hypothetical protein